METQCAKGEMSQSQSIEEIMQRIRAQVKKSAPPDDAQAVAMAPSGQSEPVAGVLERLRQRTQGSKPSESWTAPGASTPVGAFTAGGSGPEAQARGVLADSLRP